MTSNPSQSLSRCLRKLAGLAAGAAVLAALPVAAHVTLEQPQASAGSSYKAVLRVGHACAGATSTTAIPTLGEWAMLLLASLVAMFAIRRMRNR